MQLLRQVPEYSSCLWSPLSELVLTFPSTICISFHLSPEGEIALLPRACPLMHEAVAYANAGDVHIFVCMYVAMIENSVYVTCVFKEFGSFGTMFVWSNASSQT